MLFELVVWILYGFDAVKTFRRRRISSKDDPTRAPGNLTRQKKGGQVKIHSMGNRGHGAPPERSTLRESHHAGSTAQLNSGYTSPSGTQRPCRGPRAARKTLGTSQ